MGLKGSDSCLSKVKVDEPIFVLRAQDALAPSLVEEWADRVVAQYLYQGAEITAAVDAKIAEARDLAERMRGWQRNHGTKLPD